MSYYFVESYVGSFEFGHAKKNTERTTEHMVDGSVISPALESNEYHYLAKGVSMELLYTPTDTGSKVLVLFVFYTSETGPGMGSNVPSISTEVERLGR